MGPTNFVDDGDCGSYFDHIDDLIEFPPENECGAGAGGLVGPVGGEGKSFSSLWDEPLPGTDNLFAGNDHLPTGLSADISVPYEDIVQLEWMSTFVEDSFSYGGMTLGKENAIVKKEFPSTQYQMENPSNQFQMSSPVSVLESSSSTSSSSSSSGGKAIPLSPNQRGPQRARSKRPRPATFNPRLVMQHLVSAPTFIETPPPFMPTGVLTESEKFAENKFPNPLVAGEHKKKKKIKFTVPSHNMEMDQNQQSQAVRKCLHCEITKTPQWRAGPLGPKTLCNACGVRYKSGRLFPEYRPAASPTFVPAVHSNSHKKVLEMRGTLIVNEKGKDSMVGTAARTSVASQRDSVPVPFPVPESKPKVEYM